MIKCLNMHHGQRYAAYHGDSTEMIRAIPSDSIGLSLSSWPFSDQYVYSSSIRDMGNTDGDGNFLDNLAFLLPEVYRVTAPGRLAVVHCKDRIIYGSNNGGIAGIEPFSDKCTAAMRAAGFTFFGRITVSTDPVRENSQTHRLTHGEVRKDASKIGVGLPEYLLLFRKPQSDVGSLYADVPITDYDFGLPRWQIDANSHWRSDGNRLVYPWERDGYDYDAHIAHLERLNEQGVLGRANGQPVPSDNPWCWWDIQRTAVLNGEVARGNEDDKHICPLQLDLSRRVIERWSNIGDIVLDYFAGIGSVGYVALQCQRKAVVMELKAEYFATMVNFLDGLEFEQQQPTLFDLLEEAA